MTIKELATLSDVELMAWIALEGFESRSWFTHGQWHCQTRGNDPAGIYRMSKTSDTDQHAAILNEATGIYRLKGYANDPA